MGVGLTPFQLDASLVGQSRAVLQQFRAQVTGDDARSGFRGGDRCVSGACGHVEDPVARTDAGGFHQHRAERSNEFGGKSRIVAGRPHRAMFGSDVPVVRRG